MTIKEITCQKHDLENEEVLIACIIMKVNIWQYMLKTLLVKNVSEHNLFVL